MRLFSQRQTSMIANLALPNRALIVSASGVTWESVEGSVGPSSHSLLVTPLACPERSEGSQSEFLIEFLWKIRNRRNSLRMNENTISNRVFLRIFFVSRPFSHTKSVRTQGHAGKPRQTRYRYDTNSGSVGSPGSPALIVRDDPVKGQDLEKLRLGRFSVPSAIGRGTGEFHVAIDAHGFGFGQGCGRALLL
jgi:hypothetical protein